MDRGCWDNGRLGKEISLGTDGGGFPAPILVGKFPARPELGVGKTSERAQK
jgi:hypothetical protein